MKWLLKTMLFAVCLVALGCHPEKPEPKTAPDAQPSAPIAERAPHVMDIGDVEAGVWIEVTIDESSRGPGVLVEDQESRRERIVMSTADLTAMPASLAAVVRVNADSVIQYAERLVLLRGTLMVEQREAARFAVVFGRNAPEIAVPAGVIADRIFTADILDAMRESGESALVHVEAEALLLSPEADFSAVDVMGLTTDAKDMTRILSNPLRVNWKTDGEIQ